MEELCGGRSAVEHSYDDVYAWGGQELQPHQAAVVDAAAVLAGLPLAALVPFSSSSSSSSSSPLTLTNTAGGERGNSEGGTSQATELRAEEVQIAAAMRVLLSCVGDGRGQTSSDEVAGGERSGQQGCSSSRDRKRAVLSHLLSGL
jgi:hypothetical protein